MLLTILVSSYHNNYSIGKFLWNLVEEQEKNKTQLARIGAVVNTR